MKDVDNNRPKLFKTFAWYSLVATGDSLLPFLIMLGLMIVVPLSSSACSNPSPLPTTPSPTTPPPFDPYTRVPTPPPEPTRLPPVMLKEPKDGSYFDLGSEVRLCWSCSDGLQPGEYYRVGVHAAGTDYTRFHNTTEEQHLLTDLSPGEYDWGVDIVRPRRRRYEPVSQECARYHFEILPPNAVVHSISPTSTVQGASVPIIVTGENLTRSLVVTIGDVTLRTTPVSSSTMTASVPITLEVGVHRVDVEDSTGQSIWSGAFTVIEPPTPTPSVTRTPILPAYPPPDLGGVERVGCSFTFHWSWARELAKDEYFALRVGIGASGESRTWTKETKCGLVLVDSGEYVWEVAICRGDPDTHVCEQLAVSRQDTYQSPGCTKQRP